MNQRMNRFLASGLALFCAGQLVFSGPVFLSAEETRDYALSIQDLILSRHIRNAFEADTALAEAASRVRIIVTGEAVTLQGTVPNEQEKRKLEDAAHKLSLKHRKLKDQIKVSV